MSEKSLTISSLKTQPLTTTNLKTAIYHYKSENIAIYSSKLKWPCYMVVETKRLVPFNDGKATEDKSTSAIPAFLVQETKKSENRWLQIWTQP